MQAVAAEGQSAGRISFHNRYAKELLHTSSEPITSSSSLGSSSESTIVTPRYRFEISVSNECIYR